MSNENMFEVAVKNKFRFPFKGQVSVEDLYYLSLEDLDSVFKSLNSELKVGQEESLLNTKTKENTELELKIEIVKYIVSQKIAEKEAKAKEKENKEKKQRLLELLASKQDQELQNKSTEEIMAMINELG